MQSLIKNYINHLFFILSLILLFNLLDIEYKFAIIIAILYIIASINILIRLVKYGYVVSPSTAFIFSSFVYFGIGSLYALITENPYHIKTINYDSQIILKVFLIDFLSVFIVLSTFLLTLSRNNVSLKDPRINFKLSHFKIFIALTSLFLYYLIKCYLLSYPANLYFISIFDKLYYLHLFILIYAGLIFNSANYFIKIFIILILLIICLVGNIMASKEQVIVPLLSFTYGITINLGLKKSYKYLILTFAIFILSNTLINNIRYSFNYSDSNSFVDRSNIIVDVTKSQLTGKFYRKSLESTPSPELVDAHEINKMTQLINSLFYRFDVLTIQAFTIRSYDEGKGGDSISRILLTVTPRIFYKDKPPIKDEGRILNTLFYPGQYNSSATATYAGEAYWNYGFVGVILISISFGLILTLFENICNDVFKNNNIILIPISFLFILYFLKIEGWIGVTHVANLLKILFIYFLLKFFTIFFTSKSCGN